MKNKLFFILCFLLITCSKRSPVHGQNGMVVSTSRQASQVGIDILDKGGNAVDAAVAVGFTLAVTSSSNGNIGGGGFMVARLSDETTFTLDYREMAPQAAFKDMYLDSVGNVIKGKSTRTHFASGVPGSVDGLLKAWSDYGSGNISINQLIGPAIKYAEQGFKLSKYEAKRFNNRKSFLSKHAETKRIFTRTDRKWKAGDVFYQKDLAETLKRIVEKGRDGFYLGRTAELIVAEMDNVGGWITLDDLKNYSSKYREPIYGQFNDFKIISMGPPSSGGILLVLMLNMIGEIFKGNANDLDNLKFNSSDYVHLITEVERRAYADRATHLGDDDFWNVPTSMLLSKKYAQKRVEDIDLSQASLSKAIKAGKSKGNESEETTHYSVVDKDGSAVSVTTTINSGYGSGITVTGAGFIFNNEMDDFSSKPGVPNMFGLLGNEANAIQPSKRPLSSMTPSIILKDNKPFLILGTPGGSTIITTVLQNFLNVTLHSQWMPDLIDYEKNSLSKKIIKQLEEMGHSLELRGNIGEANGIMIDENGFWGGADKRGENTAVGY